MQSLLKMLWQVESLFTASLRISDFVQTHNEAKILTYVLLASVQDQNNNIVDKYKIIPTRIGINYA